MNYRSKSFRDIGDEIFNECEINGVRSQYNGCSENTLEKAKEFYDADKWEYIGSGFKAWHNGVENNWEQEHHFFIHK